MERKARDGEIGHEREREKQRRGEKEAREGQRGRKVDSEKEMESEARTNKGDWYRERFKKERERERERERESGKIEVAGEESKGRKGAREIDG